MAARMALLVRVPAPVIKAMEIEAPAARAPVLRLPVLHHKMIQPVPLPEGAVAVVANQALASAAMDKAPVLRKVSRTVRAVVSDAVLALDRALDRDITAAVEEEAMDTVSTAGWAPDA